MGNAMLRHLIAEDVREVRVFSRDESKQAAMRTRHQSDRVVFIIGDVRSSAAVRTAMRSVDFVICAAALKHVPSCEYHPREAVETNVVGTLNTVEAAIEHGVRKVVVLSTDKAVYPINAMGMTKALLEKAIVARTSSLESAETVLCATRYGNVLGSRGSVVPLFIDRITKHEPIALTAPRMTRFVLSMDDAVQFVLYAFRNAKQGDVLVRKAPAATMGDLADVLLEIFESDCPIHVVGRRPGEKLHETLLSEEESERAEDLGFCFRIPRSLVGVHGTGDSAVRDSAITGSSVYSSDLALRLSKNELKALVESLECVNSARGRGDLA